MKEQIIHIVKKLFYNKAIVLMYHRIATPATDVWRIAVSPENFEAHLKVLKQKNQVISLPQMVEQLKKDKLKKNSIVITFDDGYADNYLIAKPLLERYGLPATFFIASGNIGKEVSFWWDELEHLILMSEVLPSSFSIVINNELIFFDLGDEAILTACIKQKHKKWNASTEVPPTKRAELYYILWSKLKPFSFDVLEKELQLIRKWTKAEFNTSTAPIMTEDELLSLAQNPLFSIGAHTVNHPALAHHDIEFQLEEIFGNKIYLEEKLKIPIQLLAYPYGNFNETTKKAIKELKFSAAFTTEEKPVNVRIDNYQLPRFQVIDWNENELNKRLELWKNL